jgi:hypothetical protein
MPPKECRLLGASYHEVHPHVEERYGHGYTNSFVPRVPHLLSSRGVGRLLW